MHNWHTWGEIRRTERGWSLYERYPVTGDGLIASSDDYEELVALAKELT